MLSNLRLKKPPQSCMCDKDKRLLYPGISESTVELPRVTVIIGDPPSFSNASCCIAAPLQHSITIIGMVVSPPPSARTSRVIVSTGFEFQKVKPARASDMYPSRES